MACLQDEAERSILFVSTGCCARSEYQDDVASDSGHTGMVFRERLQDEAERITQERVKGHLQEGECEPGRISGGSG